jgi:hypothetical protein
MQTTMKRTIKQPQERGMQNDKYHKEWVKLM